MWTLLEEFLRNNQVGLLFAVLGIGYLVGKTRIRDRIDFRRAVCRPGLRPFRVRSQLRGSILDRQGLDDIEQFRGIVNYDIPVF